MSGLEGLVEAPESALLEGFGRVVATTATAHLEGLKQLGTVRAVRRPCRAKVASTSPRYQPSGRRPKGIEQLGTKASEDAIASVVAISFRLRPNLPGQRFKRGGGCSALMQATYRNALSLEITQAPFCPRCPSFWGNFFEGHE
jgi:hypothetical protein